MAIYTAKAIIPRLKLSADGAKGAVKRGLDKSAKAVRTDLEHTTDGWSTPVDFTIDDPQENTRVIGTNNLIYLFNDQPTKKHDIRPKRRKRLRFEAGGEVIYSKLVKHPGTKGKFFTKKIAASAGARTADNIRAELDKITP